MCAQSVLTLKIFTLLISFFILSYLPDVRADLIIGMQAGYDLRSGVVTNEPL